MSASCVTIPFGGRRVCLRSGPEVSRGRFVSGKARRAKALADASGVRFGGCDGAGWGVSGGDE